MRAVSETTIIYDFFSSRIMLPITAVVLVVMTIGLMTTGNGLWILVLALWPVVTLVRERWTLDRKTGVMTTAEVFAFGSAARELSPGMTWKTRDYRAIGVWRRKQIQRHNTDNPGARPVEVVVYDVALVYQNAGDDIMKAPELRTFQSMHGAVNLAKTMAKDLELPYFGDLTHVASKPRGPEERPPPPPPPPRRQRQRQRDEPSQAPQQRRRRRHPPDRSGLTDGML